MENNIAIFMRVKDLKYPVSGSTVDKCSECGEEIWVSPDMILHPKGRDARKLCFKCAMVELDNMKRTRGGVDKIEFV